MRLPGTVGSNKDWVGQTGQNPHEQSIIDCLRPHFTAKGYKPKEEPEEAFKPEEVERQGERQPQAEPDISTSQTGELWKLQLPMASRIAPRRLLGKSVSPTDSWASAI
jgi:hypothetical protein